jgi:hypothetical protein
MPLGVGQGVIQEESVSDTMIERIARILAKRPTGSFAQEAFPAMNSPEPLVAYAGWQTRVPLAIEILEAVRDPTDGMVFAAAGEKIGFTKAVEIYRAAIDAALAEEDLLKDEARRAH